MSHDYRPSGFLSPGFVILVVIAALIVVLVPVREPTQAARVWVPGVSAGANSPTQRGGREVRNHMQIDRSNVTRVGWRKCVMGFQQVGGRSAPKKSR